MSPLITAAGVDVDGLLLDTEVFQFNAWRKVIKEYSGKELSEEEYISSYCGNSSNENAKEIVNAYSLDMSSKELIKQMEVYVKKLINKHEIVKLPYATEALEFLAQRIPIALTTGAGTEETMTKLDRSGLNRIIEQHTIPIVSRDYVTNGKPAPDTYLLAATILKQDPKTMIGFEDTHAGIQAVLSANMTCFAVPNKWTISTIPKDIIIYKNLKETINHIRENYSFEESR